MKLIILRAIYFEGRVVLEGELIDTLEQHGRELIQKGYAKEQEEAHLVLNLNLNLNRKKILRRKRRNNAFSRIGETALQYRS